VYSSAQAIANTKQLDKSWTLQKTRRPALLLQCAQACTAFVASRIRPTPARRKRASHLEVPTVKKMVVLGMLLALIVVLGACYPVPASAPAFPVGKLMRPDSQTRALEFNKDGTFSALDGTTHLAEGTFSVQGDVYTETSNNQNCPSPRHYKYTFNGSKLVFRPIEDPATDTCPGRRLDFNETVTWTVAK
jgi:hypothetical protein